MKQTVIDTGGGKLQVYIYNTVVIGTGAAGLNAADRLHQYGVKDLAIITEGIHTGTSRNTGSDKQTYYKLTLAGGESDSVREMADTLFQGQCVDGDIALCEAALSAQCFLRLVQLGVPFPQNRYGEFVGYKTDHDPRCRAASAGPYTSRMMTECLEEAVKGKQIEIYDNLQVIRLLTDGNQISGVLCLDKKGVHDPDKRFVAFRCRNAIYATGGPAGIYADSVYPEGQYGATGIALLAGAKGRNLTDARPYCHSVRFLPFAPAKRKKPYGMAVWPGIGKPKVECIWYLYAGSSTVYLHKTGWKRPIGVSSIGF